MNLTIADIARMANTSTATISRVISGKPGVSEERRREILALLERAGYRPNRIAQNLALGKSGLLGVVVSNLKIPFYSQLIGLIEHCCAQYQYNLLVMDSAHDPAREAKNIETMREHRAEGLYIIPVFEYNTDGDVDHLLRLRLEKYPFVILGKVSGFDFDWVTVEETEAAAQLVRHLAGLGHRRFGFLGHDAKNRTVTERLKGIQAVMEEYHLAFDESFLVDDVGTWSNGGFSSWKPVIEDLFSKNNPPTALIAANDTIALIAIREIESLGLRVPRDVSVVGFDNSDFSGLTRPGITSSAKNMGEVARVATENLIRKIEDPLSKTCQCEIPQEMVTRESSGPCLAGLGVPDGTEMRELRGYS